MKNKFMHDIEQAEVTLKLKFVMLSYTSTKRIS